MRDVIKFGSLFGGILALSVSGGLPGAHALTLKKGQVIGADGGLYDGALDQVQAFLESDVLVENLETIAEVTQRVEAELGELATELDYYNACLENADAATCDSISDEMSEIGGS